MSSDLTIFASFEIVKILDRMTTTPLIDHVGWKLWQASELWQERFVREMVDAGYPWFGEARAALIPCIDRAGTRQAELTARLGSSKQAVQQLLDVLVDDGVLERRPDPDDARARLVCFTRKGLKVLADANEAKKRIQLDYERTLGKAEFSRLVAALERVISLRAPLARHGSSRRERG